MQEAEQTEQKEKEGFRPHVVPSVLLTQEGLNRFLGDGSLKELRKFITGFVEREDSGVPRGSLNGIEWFSAFFRNPVMVRGWFRASILGSMRKAARKNSLGEVGSFFLDAFQEMTRKGSAFAMLQKATWAMNDARLSGQLAPPEDQFFELLPDWVWMFVKSGDATLNVVRIAHAEILAGAQTMCDNPAWLDAASVAAWCIAWALDDLMLFEAYRERVGTLNVQEDPDVMVRGAGDVQVMLDYVATMMQSCATYHARTLSMHHPVAFWQMWVDLLHTALSAFRATLLHRNTICEDANAAIAEKLTELSQDVADDLERMGDELSAKWVTSKTESLLEELPMTLPFYDAADHVSVWRQDLVIAHDVLRKGLSATQKLESKLRALAADPVGNAAKLAATASEYQEKASAQRDLIQEVRKVLEASYESVLVRMQLSAEIAKACGWAVQRVDGTEDAPQTHDAPDDVPHDGGADDLQREVLVLREQLAQEQKKNREAGARIAQLQAALLQKSPSDQAADTETLMARLPADLRLTPEVALTVALALRPKLVALPTAFDSARQSAGFRKSEKLLRMLLVLGGEYADALDAGEPDAKARLLFGQDGYHANESDSVMNCEACVRARTFVVDGEPVFMAKHLVIGIRPDQRETLRVHFERIDGRIVIGHCGPHLPLAEKI